MKKHAISLFFLFVTVLAFGQETKTISLQEAFQLAAQNSKQLKLDSLKKESLSIKKQQTQNAMFPVLGLTSAYTRLSNNIEPFSISVPGLGSMALNPQILNQFVNRFSVQQPIFQGLRNWNNLKAIKLQNTAADFDILKDNQDLKWNIVQTYYNLYKLQQTSNLLDSTIAQTQVRINDLIKFKKEGLILNNDVMRAELQKTNLLVSLADVESNIETLNYNLNILLGLGGNTKLIVSDIPGMATYIAISGDYNQAFAGRPELNALDYKNKAAAYQVKAAKSAYMPTINFVGNGYYNNPNQRVFPQENKFKATWDIGVSVSWNIMQAYTAKAVVNESKNQKLQLENAIAQAKEGIQMEVNANLKAYQVTQMKIDLAQKAIEQAKENKRILNNRFNAQLALLNDVLEADILLLQAQTTLLNAQADQAIAYYKLQKSLGEIK
ncbi:MAG TPA: TolC family protein [Chitinophagales bacterium]|nr:TolC family protein [Chitinophagales bacterium]